MMFPHEIMKSWLNYWWLSCRIAGSVSHTKCHTHNHTSRLSTHLTPCVYNLQPYILSLHFHSVLPTRPIIYIYINANIYIYTTNQPESHITEVSQPRARKISTTLGLFIALEEAIYRWTWHGQPQKDTFLQGRFSGLLSEQGALLATYLVYKLS